MEPRLEAAFQKVLANVVQQVILKHRKTAGLLMSLITPLFLDAKTVNMEWLKPQLLSEEKLTTVASYQILLSRTVLPMAQMESIRQHAIDARRTLFLIQLMTLVYRYLRSQEFPIAFIQAMTQEHQFMIAKFVKKAMQLNGMELFKEGHVWQQHSKDVAKLTLQRQHAGSARLNWATMPPITQIRQARFAEINQRLHLDQHRLSYH